MEKQAREDGSCERPEYFSVRADPLYQESKYVSESKDARYASGLRSRQRAEGGSRFRRGRCGWGCALSRNRNNVIAIERGR